MEIFVDSVDLEEISELCEWGFVSGVTTNPSLVSKLGIREQAGLYAHYHKICKILDERLDDDGREANVSAEIVSTDVPEMIEEGMGLKEIHPRIILKVPMTSEGMKAISHFSKMGIRTNCTLVFNLVQAMVAARAGATYVSVFIGRLEDVGQSGISMISNVAEAFKMHRIESKIIGASVRSPIHVANCIGSGIHVVTCTPLVIRSLVKHPFTDAGLDKFLSDFHSIF